MRRRHAIAAVAVFVAAFAAYAVYWWIAAGEVRDSVERWATERRAEGWTVSYDALSVDGFPLRLRARIAAPALAGPTPTPWRWHAATLSAAVRPWNPRSVSLAAPGANRIEVVRGDGAPASVAAAAGAEGQLAIDSAGRVGRVRADLAEIVATLRTAEPPTKMAALSVTLDLSAAQPAISLTARRVILPETVEAPLKTPIEALTIDAVLTGALQPGKLPASLAAWRDAGGAIEVSRLLLDWPPLGLDADGTLALDGDMQPVGAMSARIKGYRETVDVLVAAGLVRPRDAMTAKLVLGMMSSVPKSGNRPAGSIPLSVQNRKLYVGPVSLIHLKRIDWK